MVKSKIHKISSGSKILFSNFKKIGNIHDKRMEWKLYCVLVVLWAICNYKQVNNHLNKNITLPSLKVNLYQNLNHISFEIKNVNQFTWQMSYRNKVHYIATTFNKIHAGIEKIITDTFLRVSRSPGYIGNLHVSCSLKA